MGNALTELMAKLDSLPPEKQAKIAELIEKSPVGKGWVPTPGPQMKAYNSKADVLLYGGQAGGGKSGFLIGWALTKAKRSLLMRRQYTDLKALIDDCLKQYGTRKGFSGQPPARLSTKDGRTIDFGAAKLPGDEEGWQGQAHDFLGIDEASQFLESQVRFLMGWNRTLGEEEDVQVRTVLATNPPYRPGEGQWLINFFAPWLDPKFPFPAEHGELRWVVSDEDGNDKWVDGPEPFKLGNRMVKPKSRTFIGAQLSDNPFLDEDYQAVLDGLHEPLRSAVRDGNWMIAHEDNPNQVIPMAWILAAQERWTREPPKEAPMCCMGVDVAAGGSDNTVLAARYDTWFAEPIVVPGRETPLPSDVASLVFRHRRHNSDVVVDMGGGYGGGVLEILENNRIPVYGFKGAEASSKRTQDRRLKFHNKRAEYWWKFREALNPEQENGSPIALPPDAQLAADLATPMCNMENPRGILIEDKKQIKKRLGRSPDIGDAVVMAWNVGNTYETHGGIWRDFARFGMKAPKVVHSYSNRRRRR